MKDKLEFFFYIDSITEKIQQLEKEKIEMKKTQKKQGKKIAILNFIIIFGIICVLIAGVVFLKI